MTITIKVEGELKTKQEKIHTVLDLPDNWQPNFNTITKVLGAVRMLKEKLAQGFTPPGGYN